MITRIVLTSGAADPRGNDFVETRTPIADIRARMQAATDAGFITVPQSGDESLEATLAVRYIIAVVEMGPDPG